MSYVLNIKNSYTIVILCGISISLHLDYLWEIVQFYMSYVINIKIMYIIIILGAISISLHLLSPTTPGLFQRAICQSGSALYPYIVWPPHNAHKFLQNIVTKMGESYFAILTLPGYFVWYHLLWLQINNLKMHQGERKANS